jgi:enamine deaminase RidA (YjgF/YER057c/UK114 family)
MAAAREWEHPTMGTGRGFSRALEAPRDGRIIWFAGQAPNDDSGQTVQGGIAEQAEACFRKLKALVEAAGGSMADFVMLNLYVTDVKYLREIGPIRDRYFTQRPLPASSGFAVQGLVDPSWLIEVDGVAVIPRDSEH